MITGLSVRAGTVINNLNLRNRGEVLAAIKDGRLHPRRTRHYGWKTHIEICRWLGLPVPLKRGQCPRCSRNPWTKWLDKKIIHRAVYPEPEDRVIVLAVSGLYAMVRRPGKAPYICDVKYLRTHLPAADSPPSSSASGSAGTKSEREQG